MLESVRNTPLKKQCLEQDSNNFSPVPRSVMAVFTSAGTRSIDTRQDRPNDKDNIQEKQEKRQDKSRTETTLL